MKLAELFGKGKTVFSCEVFPPKRDTPVDSITRPWMVSRTSAPILSPSPSVPGAPR